MWKNYKNKTNLMFKKLMNYKTLSNKPNNTFYSNNG